MEQTTIHSIKLGSLFDGAGTVPFAANLYGAVPVWASEIEKFPIEVTSKRLPNMKHLGDITKINGAEIEPVDIISFGSPCQDLSIAGKRAGLDGERSNLFMEAIRIIKEMLNATSGKYPKIAIWENVPGAFSSNDKEDFRVVIEEFCKIKNHNAVIPRPTANKDKWTNSGLVVGDGFSVAWRVLDAQHWGVPQRRRRIYAVADLRGERAGQILFERDGLSRSFAESRETWKGIARNSTFGANAARQCYDARGNGGGQVAPTITGDHNNRITDYTAIVVEGFGMYNQASTGDKVRTIKTPAGGDDIPVVCVGFDEYNHSLTGNIAHCLRAENTGNGLPCVVYSKGTRPHNKDEEQKWIEDAKIANTLNVNDLSGESRANELICVLNDQGGNSLNVEDELICPTLRAQTHGNLPVLCIATQQESASGQANLGVCYCGSDETFFNIEENKCPTLKQRDYKTPNYVCYQDKVGSLCARDYKGVGNQYVDEGKLVVEKAVPKWVVRRVTPKECARLQGMPDWWTDDIPHSDSAEYKMWGNGMALPCVMYVMENAVRVIKEHYSQADNKTTV